MIVTRSRRLIRLSLPVHNYVYSSNEWPVGGRERGSSLGRRALFVAYQPETARYVWQTPAVDTGRVPFLAIVGGVARK